MAFAMAVEYFAVAVALRNLADSLDLTVEQPVRVAGRRTNRTRMVELGFHWDDRMDRVVAADAMCSSIAAVATVRTNHSCRWAMVALPIFSVVPDY